THIFDSESIDTREAFSTIQKLTERQARALARIDDPSTRLNLAKFAISEKLGIRELEKLVGHPRQDTHSGEFRADDSKPNKDDEVRIAEIIEIVIRGISNKDLSPLS